MGQADERPWTGPGRLANSRGLGEMTISATSLALLTMNKPISVASGIVVAACTNNFSSRLAKAYLIIGLTGTRYGLGQHLDKIEPTDLLMEGKVCSVADILPRRSIFKCEKESER